MNTKNQYQNQKKEIKTNRVVVDCLRANRYVAYLDDKRAIYEFGIDPNDALGNLYRKHSNLFNSEVIIK